MNDIVERLRSELDACGACMKQADAEIERLRGLLIRIRDETVLDADLYDEICQLVGTGL